MEPSGAAFQLQLEVRDDPEQQKKMDETIELLLVAGYFRARVKQLTAFDKVVGGMVWCISHCDIDVDIDLLYSDTATIGQKIALTEKIVTSLGKMKCPKNIEPHQIQGLDFVHIFPVVQWLVKRAVEAKQRNADFLSSYGEYMFGIGLKPNEKNSVHEKAVGKSAEVCSQLNVLTQPPRIYKRNPDFQVDNAVDRAQCTLLEYRWRQSSKPGSSGVKSFETSDDKAPEKIQETPQSHLFEGLSEVQGQKSGDFYTISSEKVKQLLANEATTENAVILPVKYEPKDIEGEKFTISVTNVAETDLLEKNIADAEIQIVKMREIVENEHRENEKIEHELSELNNNFAQLTGLENSNDPSFVTELRDLIEQHDLIKQKESTFKQQCRDELSQLQSELDRLNVMDSNVNGSETDLTNLLEETKRAEDKLSGIRSQLATVNKKIASLQRILDSVPSQVELNQYQRRFLELYNQMSSKHRETRQYYILHNNLLDVQRFMEKEIELLENIYNVRVQASANEYKSSFVKSLQDILVFAERQNAKIDSKHKEETSKRDILREQLQEMHDKQRLYYTTAEDLAKAARLNETLRSKVADVEKCKH